MRAPLYSNFAAPRGGYVRQTWSCLLLLAAEHRRLGSKQQALFRRARRREKVKTSFAFVSALCDQ